MVATVFLLCATQAGFAQERGTGILTVSASENPVKVKTTMSFNLEVSDLGNRNSNPGAYNSGGSENVNIYCQAEGSSNVTIFSTSTSQSYGEWSFNWTPTVAREYTVQCWAVWIDPNYGAAYAESNTYVLNVTAK